jgi:hypothetical protein
MKTEAVIEGTSRVFEIVMVNMKFPYWAIAERGVSTTSHLFKTYRDAFHALHEALDADPEIKVYNIK